MRALASCYSICKSLGLNLIINWVPDNHCNCSIHSLISNIDDIGFVVNEEVYINNLLDNNYKIYNYIETEINGKKDEFIDFDKYKEVFVKSNCIINSKYSFTNYNSFFKVIKFSGRVNYLINSLETTNLIGMHIRMEGGREYCNSSYDNYKNWTEKETKLMFENRERSHINYFANQIKIILEKDPSKKFFIATDMKSNYDKLIKFYGSDKIKILERNVFDRSSSQIEYALADIILLSKCTEFYGSSWSSFSEIVVAFQCRFHSKKVCNMLSNDFQRKINGVDLNMMVIGDVVFNNKNAYNFYKNLVNEYESLKDKFSNYNLVLKVNIYCLLENINLNLLLEDNQNLKKLVINKIFTQNEINKELRVLINDFYNNKKFINNKYLCNIGYYLINKNIHNISINVDLFNKIKKVINAKIKNDSVLVIGNGPSSKNFNFNSYQTTLTMNNFYRYSEKINWYSNIYVSLDVVVTESNIKKIKEMIDNKKHELYYLDDIFLKFYPEYKDNELIVFRSELKDIDITFSDESLVTTGSDSVRLMLICNFSNINVIGVDCNYKRENNQLINGMKVIKTTHDIIEVKENINNPNYFFEGYHVKGDKLNFPDCRLKENLQKHGNDLHYLSWVQLIEAIKIFNKNNFKKVNIKSLSKNSTSITNFINSNDIDMSLVNPTNNYKILIYGMYFNGQKNTHKYTTSIFYKKENYNYLNDIKLSKKHDFSIFKNFDTIVIDGITSDGLILFNKKLDEKKSLICTIYLVDDQTEEKYFEVFRKINQSIFTDNIFSFLRLKYKIPIFLHLPLVEYRNPTSYKFKSIFLCNKRLSIDDKLNKVVNNLFKKYNIENITLENYDTIFKNSSIIIYLDMLNSYRLSKKLIDSVIDNKIIIIQNNTDSVFLFLKYIKYPNYITFENYEEIDSIIENLKICEIKYFDSQLIDKKFAIFYNKKNMIEYKDFIKIHQRKIIILGNGPSCKEIDFNKINCSTIGMNVAFRYWEKIKWFPDIYCCLDVELIKCHYKDIYKLIISDKCKKYFLRIKFKNICEENNMIFNDMNVYYLEEMDNFLFESNKHITTGAYSLRFALFMGYTDIRLMVYPIIKIIFFWF